MPYIPESARNCLLRGDRPAFPGELNYLITERVLDFLPESPRYADFNAAIGALECAKLELYRRMVAEYEDEKREANGDVYP